MDSFTHLPHVHSLICLTLWVPSINSPPHILKIVFFKYLYYLSFKKYRETELCLSHHKLKHLLCCHGLRCSPSIYPIYWGRSNFPSGGWLSLLLLSAFNEVIIAVNIWPNCMCLVVISLIRRLGRSWGAMWNNKMGPQQTHFYLQCS